MEDPRRPDVVAVLEAHLAFAREVTPEGHVHALPLEGLFVPEVTFFTAREGAELVGIGALKRLDAAHAKIKSMHTVARSRRQGVGRAVVEHLIEFARASGYERVSLETGTMAAFARARALYSSVGFETCAPFADYTENRIACA